MRSPECDDDGVQLYLLILATNSTSGPLTVVYISCSEQHRRSDHGVLPCVLQSEAPGG